MTLEFAYKLRKLGESNEKKFQKTTNPEDDSEEESEAMEVDDDCSEEDFADSKYDLHSIEDVDCDSRKDDFSEEETNHLLDEDFFSEDNSFRDDSDEDNYGECREVDTEKDPLEFDYEDYEDLVKV